MNLLKRDNISVNEVYCTNKIKQYKTYVFPEFDNQRDFALTPQWSHPTTWHDSVGYTAAMLGDATSNTTGHRVYKPPNGVLINYQPCGIHQIPQISLHFKGVAQKH